MKLRYPQESLVHIVEQAIVYQCACPAQICKAITQVRDLYSYQRECLTQTDTDRSVHERIAEACARNHAELEQCLEDVLRLEGWDLTTLKMPENVEKRRAPAP
jgi:hypothetical protein